MSESYIRVTQVRSGIGTRPKQRGSLRALGLGRVGRSRVLPDRPEIRGTIAKIPHLVAVSEADASEMAPHRRRRAATGSTS